MGAGILADRCVLARGRDPSPQPPARIGLTSPPKHGRDSTRASLIRAG
jgi:hypothetical protein